MGLRYGRTIQPIPSIGRGDLYYGGNNQTVMKDGTKIISYTPLVSPMKLDIMVGQRYRGTVRIPCNVGQKYLYEELKSFVMVLRPSLGADFDLLPSNKPKFRNKKL